MADVSRLLTPREFFAALRQALGPLLPFDLRPYHLGSGRGRLLKIHYGHPETHFEAWHHAGRGRLEVGLHFEGGRDLNAEALAFFRSRIVEVKSALPRAELEPWDRGWSGLYETIPAPHLASAVVTDGADLLAGYVTALQPMVEDFWAQR